MQLNCCIWYHNTYTGHMTHNNKPYNSHIRLASLSGTLEIKQEMCPIRIFLGIQFVRLIQTNKIKTRHVKALIILATSAAAAAE